MTRGRPRSHAKNEAIRDAAINLFLEKGFDGTSMDEIARSAGVSKQTVYSHFSSKEQLFTSAIQTKIQEYVPSVALASIENHTLEADMLAVSRAMYDLLVSEEGIKVFRLLNSAAPQGPKLAQLFWDAGPEEMLLRICVFLESWVKKGALKIDNTETAATHLISLLKGQHHFQSAIGLISEISEQESQAHVEDVVKIFLKLYRAR